MRKNRTKECFFGFFLNRIRRSGLVQNIEILSFNVLNFFILNDRKKLLIKII